VKRFQREKVWSGRNCVENNVENKMVGQEIRKWKSPTTCLSLGTASKCLEEEGTDGRSGRSLWYDDEQQRHKGHKAGQSALSLLADTDLPRKISHGVTA